MPEIDQSTKLFNTAVIATKIPKSDQGSARLNTVVGSEQFQAILKAVQIYSAENNVSEEIACEEIIRTFRAIDEIWNDYIFQAGLSKLKGPQTKNSSTALPMSAPAATVSATNSSAGYFAGNL